MMRKKNALPSVTSYEVQRDPGVIAFDSLVRTSVDRALGFDTLLTNGQAAHTVADKHRNRSHHRFDNSADVIVCIFLF